MTFYKYLVAAITSRKIKDEYLIRVIKECQDKHKNRYGYRRVKLWLEQEKDLKVNHKRVLRIMQENYLLSEIRRIRAYYYKKQGFEIYQNLLNRNFKCDTINRKWGGQI